MDLAQLHARALACQSAYGPDAQIVGPHGFFLDDSLDGDQLMIAIRGTANPHEWRQDFRAVLKIHEPFPGLVHAGFADAFDELWPGLVLGLRKVSKLQERRIHITGHSLGADLALKVAWKLHNLGGFTIRSITLFGCPRGGNRPWAEAFSRSLLPVPLRITNRCDPVPHEPPSGLYWHVGSHAWVDHDGAWHDDWPLWTAFRPNVHDHAIDEYVRLTLPPDKLAA